MEPLRAQQSQGQARGTVCPAGHLQQDTHLSLPATLLSPVSPRSHRTVQEGPGHPGKVSERGCPAQGSIRAQQGWPQGSWGCYHSLPKPLASLSPAQHVLGKVAAVAAVHSDSKQTVKGDPALPAPCQEQSPAQQNPLPAPPGATLQPQQARAELGRLTWAHRPYLVPSARMSPLLWTCTPHCGDILGICTQGWPREWRVATSQPQLRSPGASITSSGLPCTGLNCSVSFPPWVEQHFMTNFLHFCRIRCSSGAIQFIQVPPTPSTALLWGPAPVPHLCWELSHA